jgi:hypothetical protein
VRLRPLHRLTPSKFNLAISLEKSQKDETEYDKIRGLDNSRRRREKRNEESNVLSMFHRCVDLVGCGVNKYLVDDRADKNLRATPLPRKREENSRSVGNSGHFAAHIHARASASAEIILVRS